MVREAAAAAADLHALHTVRLQHQARSLISGHAAGVFHRAEAAEIAADFELRPKGEQHHGDQQHKI